MSANIASIDDEAISKARILADLRQCEVWWLAVDDSTSGRVCFDVCNQEFYDFKRVRTEFGIARAF